MKSFRFAGIHRKRDNPEKRLVQAPILSYLRFMGVFCYHHSNTGIKVENKFTGKDHWIASNMQGIPDIIGFLGPRWGKLKGRFVAIECKYGKNTATPEQKIFLEDAKNSGCISILAYDLKDVQAVLDPLQKEADKGAQ